MTGLSTSVIRIERYGPPDVLVERTVPLPALDPDSVHVRVSAAGINFADLFMRAGLYDTVPPRPFSPGFEVAGEVVDVGSNVEGWKPGDRVAVLMRYGGYARDVIVPAANLFSYPSTLSPVEAAAIPVVFLTAWVCLFEAARVRANETVLVLTAGGGVGSAATQLAVRHGMRVFGTAGTDAKRAFVVEQLGAEACFDSRGSWAADVLAVVGERGLNVALDAVGGDATRACRRLLGPLGRLVFYGLSDAMPNQKRSWFRAALAWVRTRPLHPLSLIQQNIGVFGVHLLHVGAKEQGLREAMSEVFRGVEEGELRPIVDRTFPLTREGAVAAHRYIHDRRNLGKVVLASEEAGS